jgi:hypothetical protein
MPAPELLHNLYQRLLRVIAAVRLPERRLRTNPRVVKRKMSKFHLKRPEHQHWPQPTRPCREAVAPYLKGIAFRTAFAVESPPEKTAGMACLIGIDPHPDKGRILCYECDEER